MKVTTGLNSVPVFQHGAQRGDVNEFGGEPGSHHVVGAGHALDAVAAEVGVDEVGAEEHGLPGLQLDVVDKVDDEAADVTRILEGYHSVIS